jgi:hypothetical protein
MDKIISARVDESVAYLIDSLAHELGTSKKRVIEDAVRVYSQHLGEEKAINVFAETSGAWRRKEKTETTVRHARESFRKAYRRHQK